jgi:hypothetical protein
MALDRFEVRVSIQKVLLGLVLFTVPLSILGLYLTSQSDSALDSSIGSHLTTTAQMYSVDVAHLVNDRVTAVKLISADPGVVEAVTAANRSYEKQTEPAIAEKLESAEKSWSTPQSARVVQTLLESKTSETLRHYREMDPQILRITVTDERGVAVGTTNKPARYSLSTLEAWQSIYSGGKGEVNIGGILFDNATKSYFVDVGVPVTQAKTGQLAGITIASMNISPLLANFQQDSIGIGMKAFLVNDDGMVISGPRTDVFSRARSEEYGAIRDALGTIEGRQTGHYTADMRTGRRIIAFADTGLQKTYKGLNWTVLISQDERQATAPVRMLEQFAFLMVILALFMITLLAVYYALHRKQRFEDIENILPAHHPFVPPHTA